MESYRQNFKRKEVKYRLTGAQAAHLEQLVSEQLPPSAFPASVVNSLYLDTPTRWLIERSLEKPLYKEKLRLRWYGDRTAKEAESVFLEIKKKFKGIVYKRRVPVNASELQLTLEGYDPFADATAQNANGSSGAQSPKTPLEQQIAREISAMYDRYGDLKPSALITCVRHAYEDTEETGLRITFDRDLTGTEVGTDPVVDTRSLPLLAPDQAIMEIKCSGAYPERLACALSENRAFPTSFSKYGELHKELQKRGVLRHAG